jgi:hypothetical protein
VSALSTPENLLRLLHAIEAWLLTQNLLTPDLTDPTLPLLQTPLTAIWHRHRQQERLANLRAGQLRQAVANALGFRFYSGPAGSGSWHRRSGADDVAITTAGQIRTNGGFRCVVEAVSANLPIDDQIVRRMLTLATPHRRSLGRRLLSAKRDRHLLPLRTHAVRTGLEMRPENLTSYGARRTDNQAARRDAR